MSRRAGTDSVDPTGTARDRGLSPVVGKTLELGVGVVFVALLTATFFGGIVPDYRAAVGAEVGDRALVAAAERVEASVPSSGTSRLDRRVTVRLPRTIRDSSYRIVAGGGGSPPSLRLVHPDEGVGGRVRLDTPDSVTVRGSWRSPSPSRLVVTDTGGAVTVTLVDAGSANRTSASDPASTIEAAPSVGWSP